MQRKVMCVLAVFILVLPLLWASRLLAFGTAAATQVYALPLVPLSLSPISTSTVSPSPTSKILISTNLEQLAQGLNPTILAALIGVVGVIVGALLTGAFVVYQTRRTARIEQKKQHEQFRHEQDMLRLQKDLETQYKHNEREEQRQETEAEAVEDAMRRAKTLVERIIAYRKALYTDPRIAYLQILDMSRPLEVTNVYVRVCVHLDARSSFELDPAIRAAEIQRDPNALLQASFKHLERLASSAIDPDEAIRTYKHCIFVGDPGAGKTTLLKYLTLKSADNQLPGLPDLPIRIELNAFVSSGYLDLLDFAAADWDERYIFPKADARAAMEESLKTGNALLLLDALDETMIGITPEEAEISYQKVAAAIMQLATRYPQAPIVVTARKAGYQQRAPLTGFTELEVLDFRLEDMQQFVTNWFNYYTDPQKRANGSELNTKLERNPRIRALATNPLLLSLIVLVYEAQLDLPERRAELYKRCIDILLTEWDAKRNIRRLGEFKPEHKRQLLAELAWHFHQQGRRYFPENEVLTVIANFLPKVRRLPEHNGTMLAEIASENGLLKEQARGWQGFLHLTLQEYFASQYVTDHKRLDTLLTHRGDPWWEEVLLLYAGHTPDASPLLCKLIGLDGEKNLPEDIFHTNLILAGRCLAARPIIGQVDLWNTIINRLFEVLTTTPYFLIQQFIAEALAAMGDAEANTRLLQLLSNEQVNLSMRQFIANALGQSRELTVVQELVKLLSSEQVNRYVRGSIASSLGQAQERSVASNLVRLLTDEQVDQDVRRDIAHALGELGSGLIHLLPNEENEEVNREVRMTIAGTLGISWEHAVDFDQIRLLPTKQINHGVRREIAQALGQLRERSVVSELMQLLLNEQVDRYVRMYIAEALGQLGEKSIVRELVQALRNEQVDQYVRRSIAEALGQLKEKSIVAELVQLLLNEQMNQEVRESIALSLGRLGEHSAVPELVPLLSNHQINQSVRWSIASALGRLGERSVVAELLQLLSNEQVALAIRWDIADVLEQFGDLSVAPELVQLLANRQIDPFVRWYIADVLGQLGDRSVVPELMHLLSNKQVNVGVRRHIARAVGQLGERSVVPELVRLLADEQVNLDVRRSITITLGELANDEVTIRALAALLQTPDIANHAHRVLWTVSRRAGIRVLVSDGANGKELEVARW